MSTTVDSEQISRRAARRYFLADDMKSKHLHIPVIGRKGPAKQVLKFLLAHPRRGMPRFFAKGEQIAAVPRQGVAEKTGGTAAKATIIGR